MPEACLSDAASLDGERLAADARVAKLKLIAAVVTTLVFWSGSYVAITIAAREFSPGPLSLARLGSAALILLFALPLFGGDALRAPRPRDLAAIVFMALIGFTVYHFAINSGQRIVPPGVASLLIAVLPIFAALIARAWLDEKPSARGWLGIFTAFGGVALLVTGRNNGFTVDANALLILLSALSGAAYMIFQRRLTQRYSGFALTIWGLWIGTLSLMPFAPQLAQELTSASRDAWLSVLYLGAFPTALAYVTWAYVLKMLPAARATSLLYIVPPFTFVLAWFILGERPGPVEIASGLIILGGVALVQRAPRRAVRLEG
ncbi:MAG: DMT family transporter [Gammaproteobacteria bacterium]